MSTAAAEAILSFVLLYAAMGAIFGLFFIWRGVGRIDAAARGTSWTVRLLIFPGVVALWPLLAERWRRAARDGGSV